ncbi:MAG: autotransporter domain-containing protein [Novosphingobium sp.]|jgi:outer membrane autotransporter protein|nr:autotransporter domain-containing protein [Novosphingobium sp.]
MANNVANTTSAAFARKALLCSTAVVGILAAAPAMADTSNVPDGDSINSAVTLPLLSGSIINLEGDSSLSANISLPVDTTPAELTINGAAGTVDAPAPSTVTMGTYHFNAAANSTLTLGGHPITFTGGNYTGNGGVIASSNTIDLEIKLETSLTATGNKTSGTGGAIHSGAKLTITGIGSLDLENNSAGGSGGGAINSTGLMTITTDGNQTFSGNKATGTNSNGGAIRSANGVTLTSTAGKIVLDGNEATGLGGAIANVSTSAVTIKGLSVELTNNTAATGGGGISSQGSVSITADNGNLTISGNNTATGTGGGVRSTQGTVTLEDTGGTIILSKNSADSYGGAVFGSTGITITGAVTAGTDATDDGNSASSGGVLYASGVTNATSLISVDGGDISMKYNEATTAGGAIGGGVSTTGTPTVNVELAKNSGTVTLTHNKTTSTSSTSGGGAIAATGKVTIGSADNVTTTTLNDNSAASTNTTASGGGAIYAGMGISIFGDLTALRNSASKGGALATSAGPIVVDYGDVDMRENKATATNGNGGAIIAAGGGGTGTVSLAGTTGNVTLMDNSATLSGGAIYAQAGVTVGNVDGTTTITGNHVGLGGKGGAIFSLAGPVTVNGSTITLSDNFTADANGDTNTANAGGAIFAQLDATLNGNLTADNNKSGTGGAIMANNGNVILNGASIALTNNTATKQGGGAILAQGTTSGGIARGSVTFGDGVTATSVTLTGNNATTGSGGAVQTQNGVTVNGALTASGNHAGAAVGAAAANTAADPAAAAVTAYAEAPNGPYPAATQILGGVIAAYGTDGSGVVVTGDTSLSQNSAATYGGAIFASNTVKLATTTGNVLLSDNHSGFGGAIMTSAAVELGHDGATTTLTDNTATGSGGAIYAATGVTITGALNANGNSANYGGAIYAGTAGSITQDGGDVHIGDTAANTAANYGGALYAGRDINLAQTSGNVTLANNSGSAGGALLAFGSVAIGNTAGRLTITGNKATGDGGAIYADINVTLLGTDISSNQTTGGSGGAVYAGGDFSLTSTIADTITNNSAGLQGGAIWAGGNVSLTATGGSITFAGNTQGTATTPQANAIWLDNSAGGATLTLDAAGNTITFKDPIQNNAANGLIAVTATGGGAVVFDGALYPASAADRTSQIYADTTAEGGTAFTVKNGAVYGMLAAEVSGTADPTSFTVNDASLAVGSGSEVRADTVTVNTGGLLTGAGLVTAGAGGVTIGTGARLAPGDNGGVGTLHVAGDAAFAAGSTYAAQIIGGGATSDRLTVSGTADIAAGTVLEVSRVGAANPMPGQRYTVLNATGGVTGTYTLAGYTVVSTFYSLVDNYDANNAWLDVTQMRAFTDAAATPNQEGTAAGLESLPEGNDLRDAVGLLPDDASARDAFDQLSGEIHASAQSALLEDSRFVREASLGRLRDAAVDSGGIALWGQGFGSWGSWDGNGNAAKLHRMIGGFFLGLDASLSDNVRLGIVTGYSHSSFDVKGRTSSGDSSTATLGLYGGGQWGGFALRAGAAYAWHAIDTRRSVAFAGFSDALSARYHARTAQVFGELGYGFTAGRLTLEPFANLAYVDLRTDGFTEHGGDAALAGRKQGANATFSTLGLHVATGADTSALGFTGSLGWRHAFGQVTPATTLAFAGGSDAFTVSGVPIARDVAAIEAGIQIAAGANGRFSISYNGQVGKQISDHGARASFTLKF